MGRINCVAIFGVSWGCGDTCSIVSRKKMETIVWVMGCLLFGDVKLWSVFRGWTDRYRQKVTVGKHFIVKTFGLQHGFLIPEQSDSGMFLKAVSKQEESGMKFISLGT